MIPFDAYQRLPFPLRKHACAFACVELTFPLVDVWLPIAICWRESRGNELAASRDGGHGLMQITKGFGHDSWLAAVCSDGRPLWEHPEENMLEGSRLLFCNIQQAIRHGFIGEDARAVAVAGYNASLARVLGHGAGKSGAVLILAIDELTEHSPKPYTQDVLGIAAEFRSALLNERSN